MPKTPGEVASWDFDDRYAAASFSTSPELLRIVSVVAGGPVRECAGPRRGQPRAETKARAPDHQLVWTDGRYQGPLVAQTAAAVGLRVEVVSKPPGQKGFVVLPRRWVVERTFAWLGKYRRVAGRDYETNPRNSEAWIKSCLSNLMLRRLANRIILKPDD